MDINDRTAMHTLFHTNLDQLRHFHAVVTAGSMSAAARVLCLTQPAISRSISLLEDDLGVRLFLRTGRLLKVTAEGRVVFEAVSKMLTALKDGDSELELLRETAGGVIHIGVTQLTLRYFLLPFIANFHERFPNVKIVFHTDNMKELYTRVREGNCDFSIVARPNISCGHQNAGMFTLNQSDHTSGIDCFPLAPYRFVLAASRHKFPELCDRECSLRELLDYPWIVMKPSTITRQAFEALFAAEHLSIPVEYECDMMGMVSDLTRAGLGIGTLFSPALAMQQKDAPELFEVKLKYPVSPGELVLLKRTDLNPTRVQSAFIDCLKIPLRSGDAPLTV